MLVCMSLPGKCCSKLVLPSVAALLDELTALSNGQLMNNELVPSTLNSLRETYC